jgi:hypothetical protein
MRGVREIICFPVSSQSFRSSLICHDLPEALGLFRDSGYVGASETSKSLLSWWFKEPHLIPSLGGMMVNFQYYFAQREALETIIYLYDVVGAKDKYDKSLSKTG